jgi:hypothetical protein
MVYFVMLYFVMVYFVMLYFVMVYFVMVYIIMLYFVACITGDLLKIKKCTMKGGDWCNGGCIANISALNETYRSLIIPNCSNFTTDPKSPSDEFFQ